MLQRFTVGAPHNAALGPGPGAVCAQQAERAQDTGAKECGLHSGNMVAAAAAQAAGEEQRDLWVGGAVEALDKGQLQALLAGPRERHTLVVFYAPWCPFSQARPNRLVLGGYLGRKEL